MQATKIAFFPYSSFALSTGFFSKRNAQRNQFPKGPEQVIQVLLCNLCRIILESEEEGTTNGHFKKFKTCVATLSLMMLLTCLEQPLLLLKKSPSKSNVFFETSWPQARGTFWLKKTKIPFLKKYTSFSLY